MGNQNIRNSDSSVGIACGGRRSKASDLHNLSVSIPISKLVVMGNQASRNENPSV